jgi:COMPASS component SWD3
MIKWDPAGSLLASCAEDDVVYLWSSKSADSVKAFKGHTSAIDVIKWNNHPTPGSATNPLAAIPVPILATGSRDNTVKLWDVEYGRCIMTLEGHQ